MSSEGNYAMRWLALLALVAGSQPVVAQGFGKNVASAMDGLRRCMTGAILDTINSKSAAVIIVENAFAACKSEESLVTSTVADEHPGTNSSRLVAGMKVEMKKDYVSQINDLRARTQKP